MSPYVFGAGASRDVGYPLASDMGDGLLDYMLQSPHGSIRLSVPDTSRAHQRVLL
jgi:hypothetical protein